LPQKEELHHQDSTRPYKCQNNGGASALLLIPLHLAPCKISITDLLMELTESVKLEYDKQDGQHLELPVRQLWKLVSTFMSLVHRFKTALGVGGILSSPTSCKTQFTFSSHTGSHWIYSPYHLQVCHVTRIICKHN
jgi:hypothetical protein